MNSHEALQPAVVIVGASRGIGRSIAKVAAREGARIVLVARSAGGLAAAASEVRQAGGEAFMLELDLLEQDSARRLEDFLTSQGLACDVLVNSAGHGLRGAAIALAVDDQLAIIHLNIRAICAMTLHFLPGMVARKRGGVINLGSVAGFTPGPYMALYYSSKAFLRSFSQALHQEVRHAGVTVTCVTPGPVATEFLQSSGAGQTVLFNILPKLGSDEVAARAWKGFKAGRRMVVPGISGKLIATAAALLPAAVRLPLIGSLQRSGNDPCPCGSGKKFKKCCGARQYERRRQRFANNVASGRKEQ